MNIGSARHLASQWVIENERNRQGYIGAYFSGSIIGKPDDMELPPSSDVDIVVVVDKEPALKLGKFRYQGVLLEITYLSQQELASVEHVLTSYHLAGSFRMDTIIDDPKNFLRPLQVKVSQHFFEETWVRKRCENARQKVENGLHSLNVTAPFHNQVMGWLFSTGVTTHVLLVAALKNPTVRKRYVAVKEVLTEYGYADLYKEMLELLGCLHMSAERVEYHLDQLAKTFDQTVPVAQTPFFFSTDISEEARSIAIDGSHELIRTGNHREAIFWIVATFCRCHIILTVDDPNLHEQLYPDFIAVVRDLGITSSQDLKQRSEKVKAFLPKLWEVTEDIIARNPKIIK